MGIDPFGGQRAARRPDGAPVAAMQTVTHSQCHRCGCALVPVHQVEEGRRRIVAWTCPEPYCDDHRQPGLELPASLARCTRR